MQHISSSSSCQASSLWELRLEIGGIKMNEESKRIACVLNESKWYRLYFTNPKYDELSNLNPFGRIHPNKSPLRCCNLKLPYFQWRSACSHVGILDAVFEVPIEVLHKFGLRSAPRWVEHAWHALKLYSTPNASLHHPKVLSSWVTPTPKLLMHWLSSLEAWNKQWKILNVLTVVLWCAMSPHNCNIRKTSPILHHWSSMYIIVPF